ncbi:LytTR family DNA-binding domain-containing protein [Undibacterium cyanobacteriorum]|uniref:LytTR family DNA-binding domain-containing protein n=1 Tax=Undibacterium cyanobacteriorum TaxID=3073561 RepID=A0ABY9RG43_9BURK|nr:LytTR family DNA-binding domain-containing protein [Undibacterium sp. 20NA77.5]WMW79629.1 LytTR family DNA-binding domain-containing protein [Undibacterium sp. 20NA77.5]
MTNKAPRALIAEDEEILALTLKKTLEKLWPELDLIGIAENGIEAVNQALKEFPDIIFLDIKMPGKTGLEVAEELADEWPADKAFPHIVFVTAYDEYAIEAFEHQAVDYVLKPISDVRISKTVQRLQNKFQAADERPDELQTLIAQLSKLSPALGSGLSQIASEKVERLHMIRAAVGSQIRMIPVEDVLYFEATDKYINVVTAEQSVLIRMSLRELLPQLDASIFWQVHRSHIVNTRHLEYANRDESGKLFLQLKGCKQKVQVSRVYAHLFKQM